MAGNPYSKYGLTVAGYNRLHQAQNGLCKICNCPPDTGKKLVVDHNHQTGAVRGLLCFRCNSGLGFFADNQTWLASAIQYLDATGTPVATIGTREDSLSPLARLKIAKRELGERWNSITELQVGPGLKFKFSDTPTIVLPHQLAPQQELPAAPALPEVKDKHPLEGPLDAADLALSPPLGMLSPVPEPRGDN